MTSASTIPLNASQVTELYNNNTPGSLSLTLTVSSGTLTLGNPAASGLSYSAGDGTDDATMTISGSASVINTAGWHGLYAHRWFQWHRYP